MINTLKFQNSPESRIFFFSDFHYDHDPKWEVPLWKVRGFNSVIEHNETLVSRWNAKVRGSDVVFVLDDTVFGKGAEDKLKFLFKTLNYKYLYIMPGNHHAGYKQLFNQAFSTNRIDPYYRLLLFAEGDKEVFAIPNYYEIFVGNKPIVLCHYPILSWNGMAQGSFLCYGHVHQSLSKVDWTRDNYLKGKVLDVGPESVGEPQSFDEIMKIMAAKEIVKTDHHSKETSTPFC
jgi:calcineurin-like phosphoesterase family protein